MNMAKNVALSNRAYSELEKIKSEGESFSDIVLRLLERKNKVSWRSACGAMKDDESARIFTEILEKRHRHIPREVRI